MDVSIEERWKPMVDKLVETGRYHSASEVVDEALGLMREREAKLAALRATIEASIARGGSRSSEEVSAYLEAEMDKWEQARNPQ